MKNFVKEGQKLPLYGIGPMIVFAMGAVTAIGIILSAYVWKTGILEGPWALFCRIAGALLIVSGLTVWFIGALRSDMDASIAENRLQTGGIYAWVRNPMYSGWWMLFANLPMFRLEGTEHMDKAYHQKWFHLKGMLFPGIVFALIPAALVGWLIVLVR